MSNPNDRMFSGTLRDAGKIDLCKACGAPIYWLESPKTHKLAPIDYSPSGNGNLRIDLDHGVYLHILDMAEVPPINRHKSHFATCPNAEEFRRGRT